MLLHIYQLIAIGVALLIVRVTLKEQSMERQIAGAIVLIPLLLRMFLIK